jgi:hypothetical protein
MSFTEDELQAFNTILEQRFAVHRQEMEQALAQRMNDLRQDIAQQLHSIHQETDATLRHWLMEQENKFATDFIAGLSAQQDQIAQTFHQAGEQQQQQIEVAMERMLAAQLSGIEHLLTQQASLRSPEQIAVPGEPRLSLETIEVQAELPWGDLTGMIGQALDERLVQLDNSVQRAMKSLEQYLTAHLPASPDQGERTQLSGQAYLSTGSLDTTVSMQEVLNGIEQLERMIESTHIAMTANHALISNRLYHHQQLPLERAHPAAMLHTSPLNSTSTTLSPGNAHHTNGLELENPDQQKEIAGPEG